MTVVMVVVMVAVKKGQFFRSPVILPRSKTFMIMVIMRMVMRMRVVGQIGR
jgi:hypothetical protein